MWTDNRFLTGVLSSLAVVVARILARALRAFDRLACSHLKRGPIMRRLVPAALAMGLMAGSAAAGTLTSVTLTVSDPTPNVNADVTISFVLETSLSPYENVAMGIFPANFVVTDHAPDCRYFRLKLGGQATAFAPDANCLTWNNGDETHGVQINLGDMSLDAGTAVAITLIGAASTTPHARHVFAA
jgi:hypothetical protein